MKIAVGHTVLNALIHLEKAKETLNNRKKYSSSHYLEAYLNRRKINYEDVKLQI